MLSLADKIVSNMVLTCSLLSAMTIIQKNRDDKLSVQRP